MPRGIKNRDGEREGKNTQNAEQQKVVCESVQMQSLFRCNILVSRQDCVLKANIYI